MEDKWNEIGRKIEEKIERELAKHLKEIEKKVNEEVESEVEKSEAPFEDLKDLIELKGVLKIIGDEIPKMIRNIVTGILNPEVGGALGKTIGSFYQSLVEAGMPEDEAREMTREFVRNISGLMRSFGKFAKINRGVKEERPEENDEDENKTP